MKHFFRGGRGLPCGQGDSVNELSRSKFPIFGTGGTQTHYQDFSSRPISINDRLLSRSKFPIFGTGGTSLATFCSDEGGESLRATFVLASPLIRRYITDSSPFQYLFNTSESRIVDEKVIKRCSGGNETPKLVRSRYESDQASTDLSSFVPTDYLPYNFDVSRRVQENRKKATKTRIEKWIEEKREDVDETSQKGPDAIPTVYRLSSALVLPLFCLCSTSPRSRRDCAVTWLRSFIGASSQNHRSAIEAPSEKGRTRLGPGRDLVGSFSAYPLPRGRSFFGLEPSGYQRTGEERADKYQAKPKPSPEKEQRSTKEQAENKQRISKASVWSFNTLLIHCYYLAYTWGILRRYTKKASTRVAGSFSRASGLGRNWLQSCSTAVRQLFESCSAVSRRTVEALSKATRRSAEDFPNPSRSVVEDFPKSSRRIAKAEGARTKVELALTQPITKVELGMNYQTTKDELGMSLARTNVELGMNYQTAKDELGMSLERTGGKEEDCFIVVPPFPDSRDKRNDGSDVCSDASDMCNDWIGSRSKEKVVNDLREKRLILKGFRELCEEFRPKVESMLIGEKIKRERGLNRVVRHCAAFRPVGNRNEMERSNLKGVTVDNLWSRLLRQARSDGRIKPSRYDDIKRAMAYSLKLITIMCVLCSIPDLLGARALAQIPQQRAVSRLSLLVPSYREESGTNFGNKQEFVKDIRGTVTDAVTKMPLEGVGVEIYIDSVKYAGRYALDNGTFDFKGAHITHGTLRVSKAGYIRQEVPMSLSQNGPYDVALRPEAIAIEEVEVISTGFFSVPKERATGSFTHVNNELLSRSVGSNVIDRLKDVVPGLTFNQRQIGKSTISNEPSISIRGRSTMKGNAEPLVILDNFPYEGKIEDINPEDIESVTVLQDAAAASIWGARAGNGVIVLTSKQGHREQPMQVNWRSDYSISAKPDLYYAPTIPMDEFIEVERFLFNKNAWNPYINQGYSYITPAVELLKKHHDKKLTDMELEEVLDVLKGQDVRRDLGKYFYRPSSLRKTFLSFNGGGKRNTYYFSAGYDQNVSDKVGTDNQRISINMRNSYELWKDKLRLDVGLLFAKTLDRSDRSSSVGYNVLYDRLVDEAGNPLSIGGSNKFRQSYIDTAGNGLLKDWNYRPVEEIGMSPIRVNNLNYQLSTGFEYKALDWLTLSGQYRYQSGWNNSRGEWNVASFQMRNLYNQFTKINHAAGTATSAIPDGGQLNLTQSTLAQHNGRAQLAINKRWVVHRSDMVLGAEVNKQHTNYTILESMLGYQPATETHTPIDLMARYPQYHVASSSSLLVSPAQNQIETTDSRNVLLFGNASYSYDRRYTATFSVRKDRANIFGVEANKKGKPFMSAGMLWNVHEEAFVQLPWLQKLSLRGTLGTMGNVSTASAYLTSQVGAIVDPDNGRKFQRIITAPNPLLSWEKVRMLNLAMDFSLLNSKLSGTIERYYRTSTDLLSYNPMTPSSGVSTLYGNWSAMKSSGWDISLNSRLRYGDFSWNGNLILSHIKDRVTDYYEKPTSDRLYLTSAIGQYPIEGKPLNTIYSLPYAGLDGKGDPLGYLDGQISADYAKIYNNTPLSEYVYHGRATPNTFGSLRNSFGYKGIELSFMLSYHLGYYFRQQAFSSSDLYMVTGYGSSVFQSHYTERWQQAGDEATTRVPAAVYPVNGNREVFYGLTEDHVQRGDHIRFRDVRLSYSFPGLKNGLIRNLQVYGYVDNVGLLWAANENGFDPLVIPGIGLTYPAPRTYALGVNLKF